MNEMERIAGENVGEMTLGVIDDNLFCARGAYANVEYNKLCNFVYPCVIRKNTPELIEALKDLGYSDKYYL